MATGPILEEAVIEPDLPVVDPHHHLWFVPPADHGRLDPKLSPYFHVRRRTPRYLFDDLFDDLNSGHRIEATVFVECHAMYRQDGPAALRSLGEVEFANGAAAMAASGGFGAARACAGIIGHVDLAAGEGIEPILEAHMAAAGGRYRGVRHATQYDADPAFAGVNSAAPHQLLQPAFQAGASALGRLGLVLDVFVLEPQLPEVLALALACPYTAIVLNHTGTPLGFGRYAGRRAERFPMWRHAMRRLAECSNVAVKLGGLGMPIAGFPSFLSAPPASSLVLADEWRPYVETCIEIFGVNRCMFESNFPTESGTASYRVLWNAFKRLASGASAEEKAQLFSGVARRVYRLA